MAIPANGATVLTVAYWVAILTLLLAFSLLTIIVFLRARSQRRALRDKRAQYFPALHPVIRTHPVTGKRGLFVNESMTTFIKGMDRKESDMLLRYLFDYLRTPEFNYRHKWKTNDLAVWDNRVSLHYALFDYTEHRLMHRIVIQGDVPHA